MATNRRCVTTTALALAERLRAGVEAIGLQDEGAVFGWSPSAPDRPWHRPRRSYHRPSL
jgi:hypothetical protein